ncbi:MAG TPA: D-alanyl-D-alanine carboxypeptidase [Homoserinimonas sp.]|nr:D-alanyl-D-alanine carboxypeptidase [Homoserinimonas sp.]
MSDESADDFSALAGMMALARENARRELVESHLPHALAARRRRRRRRLTSTGIVGLVVAAVVGTYIPVTLLASPAAAIAVVETPALEIPAAVTLALPEVGASVVIVAGAEQFLGEDGIIASSGGNDPRPIASITKVITSLVILDAYPIAPTAAGPSITFSEADADLYDEYYVKQASVWPLKAGSAMPLRDALHVMLVVSATNYADAVTRWAFGSHANFVSATRSWLEDNGLSGTTIVEPTGLDPRNLSTPTDLVAIGKLAMANPVVAEMVNTSSLVGANGAGWPNTNGLLGVDGINGIKTGTLDAAGACLLFSALVDVAPGVQLSVIGVVLGGDNHYQVDNAVRALLASVRAGFHEVPVLTEGQKLGTYRTPWGDEALLVAAQDASVFTWSDMPIQWSISTDEVESAETGEVVGEAKFISGDSVVTVPLKLDGHISGPDDWWRLTHPAELLGL